MAVVVSCFRENTKENHRMQQFNYVFLDVSPCMRLLEILHPRSAALCLLHSFILYCFRPSPISPLHFHLPPFSLNSSSQSLSLFSRFSPALSPLILSISPLLLFHPSPPPFIPLLYFALCLSSSHPTFISPLLHSFTWTGGGAAGLLHPCARGSNRSGDV